MPPFPSSRSSLYLPSTIRWRRVIRLEICPEVAAASPPPVWSAPQAKQNRELSGSGVWHLVHSITEAGMGSSPPAPHAWLVTVPSRVPKDVAAPQALGVERSSSYPAARG